MKERNNVFIDNEFRNVDEKSKEESHYKVIIRESDNHINIIEDAVDLCFNNSILTVATVPIVYYYRIKNLINWSVERLT